MNTTSFAKPSNWDKIDADTIPAGCFFSLETCGLNLDAWVAKIEGGQVWLDLSTGQTAKFPADALAMATSHKLKLAAELESRLPLAAREAFRSAREYSDYVGMQESLRDRNDP